MGGLQIQSKLWLGLSALALLIFASPCFAQFASDGQPGWESNGGGGFTACTMGDPDHKACRMAPPVYNAPMSTPTPAFPQTSWWGPQGFKRDHMVKACTALGGTIRWGPTFYGYASATVSRKYQDAICVTGANSDVYQVIGRYYGGDVALPMPASTNLGDAGNPNYNMIKGD